MREYEIIKNFYGEQCTKRSGVLLIQHIDEGLRILNAINASDKAKRAYCLHPILQSDEAFVQNKGRSFEGVSTEVLILTMEYRRVANSYLSKDRVEDFVGFSCPAIKEMLTADKIQNYKDFMLYHYGKHERSDVLYTYFHNWFELLGVDWGDWVSFDFA